MLAISPRQEKLQKALKSKMASSLSAIGRLARTSSTDAEVDEWKQLLVEMEEELSSHAAGECDLNGPLLECFMSAVENLSTEHSQQEFYATMKRLQERRVFNATVLLDEDGEEMLNDMLIDVPRQQQAQAKSFVQTLLSLRSGGSAQKVDVVEDSEETQSSAAAAPEVSPCYHVYLTDTALKAERRNECRRLTVEDNLLTLFLVSEKPGPDEAVEVPLDKVNLMHDRENNGLCIVWKDGSEHTIYVWGSPLSPLNFSFSCHCSYHDVRGDTDGKSSDAIAQTGTFSIGQRPGQVQSFQRCSASIAGTVAEVKALLPEPQLLVVLNGGRVAALATESNANYCSILTWWFLGSYREDELL